MNKRRIKRLTLNRETLRNLEPKELQAVAAGACATVANCQTYTCGTGLGTQSCVTCVVTRCSQILMTEDC